MFSPKKMFSPRAYRKNLNKHQMLLDEEHHSDLVELHSESFSVFQHSPVQKSLDLLEYRVDFKGSAFKDCVYMRDIHDNKILKAKTATWSLDHKFKVANLQQPDVWGTACAKLGLDACKYLIYFRDIEKAWFRKTMCKNRQYYYEVEFMDFRPNKWTIEAPALHRMVIKRDDGIVATLNRGCFEIHEFLSTEDTFVVQCIVLLFAQAFIDGVCLP
eukprot:TRINITY_DN840_c0_g1_i1.p1 TRINITY_DN840_c0_g1~~TRINITY_DN840_c0_g1_i1.p1  ORF type:complete len:215 (-),score=47.85 TRINITY_DN840_c0_g1_i1:154-798(-)